MGCFSGWRNMWYLRKSQDFRGLAGWMVLEGMTVKTD